jgi:acyl-CoA synthetase (NDP forming)
MVTDSSVTTIRQTATSLDFLFRPRGIAVIGASSGQTRLGSQVLANLLEAGYPGHIAAIGPAASSVAGVPAYPSLDAVPGPVELLVLALPAPATAEMADAIRARASRRRDLKAVVAIGGGFAETETAEGRTWQQSLAAACQESGVRLVGPNSAGVIDNKNRVDTTVFAGVHRRPGGVSLLSESGSLGEWVALELSAQPLPIGLNKFVHLGNMADVALTEMIDYLGRDASTRAVGLCLEGNAPPLALLEAAGRTAEHKPVMVLQADRNGSGGALQQYGLIRSKRVDEFAMTLSAFARLPLPLGGRVALLTNAGGPGRYAQNCLSDRGLDLASFSASTRAMLAATLPPFAGTGHPDGPVDMTGDVAPRQVAQCVATALRDPGVDAVFHLFIPSRFATADEMARELLLLLPGLKRHSLDKPYFPVLLAGHAVAGARRLLEENGVPTFGSPDLAAAALSAMVRYSLDRQPPAVAVPADGN